MKKLLLLGGASYLLPVIRTAQAMGIYVITCDYLPDNIAHKYSDEYRNVSIIDRDAVLETARELNIDGVMSFACDPGVTTAAYVAEKLSLPFAGSYESVCILQNKARFRDFLRRHGFNAPWSFSFRSVAEAAENAAKLRYPAIVKPVDSAGSKGVSRIDSESGLAAAVEYALGYSLSGAVIVEEFLEKEGASSDTDSFSVDGVLRYASFDDQLFDADADNPYTPAAYCWPSSMPEHAQRELRGELQRLITLLDLKTSVYNIETRLCKNGKTYIMEMSPRGGGNRLCEVLHQATGVDLIRNAVCAAVSLPVEELHDPVYDGCWAEIILHADRAGRFRSLWIDPAVEDCVVERDLWIKEGDEVEGFTGANKAVGTLVLRFDDRETLDKTMSKTDWVKLIVD